MFIASSEENERVSQTSRRRTTRTPFIHPQKKNIQRMTRRHKSTMKGNAYSNKSRIYLSSICLWICLKKQSRKRFLKKNRKSRDFATKIDRFHRKLALIRQISRYFSVESTMPITYNLFILYKYHIIFTLSQHRDNNFVAKMASVLQCVH